VRFRFSLLASVFAHLGLASVLWLVMGGHLPWREEMVIDLTGSFRTRPASTLADGGGKSRNKAVKDRDEMTGQAGAEDSEAPLFDVTKLPELSDQESLRGKLERYYPAEARRNGQEGVVLLEVVVSSRGTITESKVIKSEPEVFAVAALRVVTELVFTPAYLGNRPVAVRIRLPIRFELER
jgi:TonB family protein